MIIKVTYKKEFVFEHTQDVFDEISDTVNVPFDREGLKRRLEEYRNTYLKDGKNELNIYLPGILRLFELGIE